MCQERIVFDSPVSLYSADVLVSASVEGVVAVGRCVVGAEVVGFGFDVVVSDSVLSVFRCVEVLEVLVLSVL